MSVDPSGGSSQGSDEGRVREIRASLSGCTKSILSLVFVYGRGKEGLRRDLAVIICIKFAAIAYDIMLLCSRGHTQPGPASFHSVTIRPATRNR